MLHTEKGEMEKNASWPKLGMLEEQRQHVCLNTDVILQCEDMCKSAFMETDTGVTVMTTFFIFLNILITMMDVPINTT